MFSDIELFSLSLWNLPQGVVAEKCHYCKSVSRGSLQADLLINFHLLITDLEVGNLQ